MHSHSQAFKGNCETKRTIPVIPRKPGWFQERALSFCKLFTFLIFFTFHVTFYFLWRCPLFTTIKVMLFFDWSFSHLHVPSLKLAEVTFDKLGFGSYIKLKFHAFGVFPNAFLSASAFYFWKVSAQFGQVFLVRWNLLCDLFKKPCSRDMNNWQLLVTTNKLS